MFLNSHHKRDVCPLQTTGDPVIVKLRLLCEPHYVILWLLIDVACLVLRQEGWQQKPKAAWRICVCGSGELAFCIKREDWGTCVCVCNFVFVCHPQNPLNHIVWHAVLPAQKTTSYYWSPWVTLTKNEIKGKTAQKIRPGTRQGCLNGFESISLSRALSAVRPVKSHPNAASVFCLFV